MKGRNSNRRAVHSMPRRSGQSLVLMMFILIALIGVMALTLDFGFVLLSRRQMQTGVNTAAVEGLRGQGELSETDRRENAREILRLTFDDNLDPSANPTTIGAGIDSSLIQGDGFQSTTIGPGNTTLAEDLANRSSFIYRPDDFQENESNEIHGDMVSGQYVGSATVRPIAGGRPHEEFSDYRRMDFRTSDETDYDSVVGDDAFLVRMRRTHNPNGLDEVSGVSSRGGGLPLLLARAGWMQAEDASAAYSVRRDGVTVRATAIAQAVPAMSVGPPSAEVENGLANFWLQRSEWESGTVDVPSQVNLNANGEITGGYEGAFVERRLSAIGENLTELTSIPTLEFDEVRYVPIYEEIEGVDRIVGFGRVRLTNDGMGNNFITKLPSAVAAQNATSQLYDPSIWSSLSPLALESLLAGFRSFHDEAATTEPLRVPGLVRSIR